MTKFALRTILSTHSQVWSCGNICIRTGLTFRYFSAIDFCFDRYGIAPSLFYLKDNLLL